MFDDIIEELAKYSQNPLGFVYFAFPWGEPGTDLERATGPEPWQAEILRRLGAGIINLNEAVRLAVTSGHGVGKAQPHSTVIDTPTGRRRWGDLKAGDWVFGRNGKPTRIVATHPQGIKPVYAVRFDDGTTVETCGEHLWNVRGRQERRWGFAGYRTMSTEDIIRQGVKRANGTALARQWEIPRIDPVEYPAKAVPIEPYMLGVWLGNGHGSRFTSADEELAYMASPTAVASAKAGTHALSYYVSGLKDGLRKIGLLHTRAHNKRVPTLYKEQPSFARAELLRGLLDTDGECNDHGSIIFSSISYALAEDVVWLVRSLGGKAQFQPTDKRTGYRRPDGTFVQCQICYRVTIQMPHDFTCFYLERKQSRVRNVQERYLTRWIDAIEPLGQAECMCITVEAEDSLYLTNDFVPTHNSALVAWIILWAISTFPDARGVVTANTETQLKTKTWVELATWYRRFIARDLFKFTATALFSADPERERTWRIDLVPWSERNTEAFAGLHNKNKRIVVIYDEASAIPDTIWEVTEGALTDEFTEIIWCAFGNPTRNKGRFRDCFAGGKFERRWRTLSVDSRTVSFTNKDQIDEWIDDWGEDSDFVRVRVLGQFPRIDAESFIGLDLALSAVDRIVVPALHEPVILGVDVGRFGDDPSVIYPRRGRDASSYPITIMPQQDTMTTAAKVVEQYNQLGAALACIDGTGVGGGVVDRCRQLGINVLDVQFGEKAQGCNLYAKGEKYYLRRSEMWGELRGWLATGSIKNITIPTLDGSIRTLTDELTAPQFGFNSREEIQLESKKDMRSRDVPSPNVADALACTHAMPNFIGAVTDMRPARDQDANAYDPYAPERIYDHVRTYA